MKFVIAIILKLIVIGECCQTQEKIKKSIVRGGYKNVLHLNNGALISSRIMNYFNQGQIKSLCLRDSIYNTDWTQGYYACHQGGSIIIDLIQTYELNTLKLRIWDLQFTRWYNLEVYVIYNNIKTLIFQSLAQSVIAIKFKDQYVGQIEIQSFFQPIQRDNCLAVFNRNGNIFIQSLKQLKLKLFIRQESNNDSIFQYLLYLYNYQHYKLINNHLISQYKFLLLISKKYAWQQQVERCQMNQQD